jgi:hypothetical protein
MLGLSAFLEHERYYKRLRAFPQERGAIIRFFLRRYAERIRLSKEMKEMMIRLEEIYRSHKESSVEIGRERKFLIISQGYNIISVDEGLIKAYLGLVRELLSQIGERIR